eukprot:CAMPEP_0181423006 /NCGR_PEP_ID=MMETSP1110-20121109/13905_1 /TAXON_ID=174948 /ORGANISM="Symbiodinium sp., Strain CCMP421" /LENGTH=165 /DNA_ID=CAMNT_0023546117 /DNA_START=55 /DNA_END=552 /DNA_ORIENTATION=-
MGCISGKDMREPMPYRAQRDYDCEYERRSCENVAFNAQPEYGQPMYGQPYGQPAYEPSFGPGYAQPPYAQAPYAQPPYAQPPYAQAPYAQPQPQYEGDYQSGPSHASGARMAMAAAGGVALGAGTAFAVEHAGDIGRFAEDAVDDVGGFVGDGFHDVGDLARDIF